MGIGVCAYRILDAGEYCQFFSLELVPFRLAHFIISFKIRIGFGEKPTLQFVKSRCHESSPPKPCSRWSIL